MSASLQLYRGMIPAHASVPDVTVELWLELAASRHSAAAWGQVYAAGMVLWAASALDALVQVGQAGTLSGGVCDPVVVTTGKVAVAQEDSVYWAKYLDLRNSRAAGAPGHIGPSASWPDTGWPGWVLP